MLFDNVFVD